MLLIATLGLAAQDTLRYDTIVLKNGNRSVYKFDGYWILRPDTLFNVQGPYKLKVPTIDLGNPPNTYYYYSYSRVITVKRFGKTLVVMDRFRKSTTIYKKVGFAKFLYITI